MIALTWIIDLPRASDGGRIKEFARGHGNALAQAEGLLAGVTAMSRAGVDDQRTTSYAMLSIWANTSKMNAFLWGEATASLEHDVARPSGRLWAVSSVQLHRERLAAASHVGLEIVSRPDAALADRVDAHRGAVGKSLAGRSTALSCRGFDPSTWSEVAIDVWTGRPRAFGGRVFQVVSAAAPER